MMEKKRICEAFGRAAAAYDLLALFQRRVCERMLCLLPEWLPHGFSPENILDGGCGTGFGAQCLRSFWPDARLTGCDLSGEMVERMRQKGFSAVCGDLEAMSFDDGTFDFVWSSLALQWCRPQTVFRELRRVLARDGILYFSTLAPGTLCEIAHAFEGVDTSRRVLSFSSPDEQRSRLQEAGFSGIRVIHETHRMYYPDVRSALESVRGIGAGYSAGKRRAMMGKTAWKTVQQRYEALREAEGLPVTYELVIAFGIAGA